VNNENGNGITNRFIWESLPASEYVDTVFGTGTLVPKDPYERCLVQIWCDHCTNRIQQQYYKALMAQDMTQRKGYIQQFHIECRALAQAMYTSGPYFLGNRFSMVDVVFAPFWQRILWIGEHYISNELLFPFDDDDKDFQRLYQWWDAVRVRPSITATLVCKERLISSYSDYALNVATSDFAKSINS
jgi:glutathione S-transferase